MITLIAAISENGVIGKDGQIPWRLPADLKRFKALTMGHVLVMGRKTYESIGRPLPGRRTIVLTRARAECPSGVWTARSLLDAVTMGEGGVTMTPEGTIAFICGGAEVYREALDKDFVDRLELTMIGGKFEGDTVMPPIDYSRFDRPRREAFFDPTLPYTFETWNRKAKT